MDYAAQPKMRRIEQKHDQKTQSKANETQNEPTQSHSKANK
jgi:hypothetical protein